jgi:hypothetical protein
MGADIWVEKSLVLGSVFLVTQRCVEQAYRLFLVCVTALFALKGLHCDCTVTALGHYYWFIQQRCVKLKGLRNVERDV